MQRFGLEPVENRNHFEVFCDVADMEGVDEQKQKDHLIENHWNLLLKALSNALPNVVFEMEGGVLRE